MLQSEEDWFYDSISRYKNLNMFELEYPVRYLEPTSCNSICVSCSNNRRHQLLELSLPLKIISQANNSPEIVITNDNDLKIKCGTFIQTAIAHVKTLRDGHKAVVSLLKTQGITLYTLSCDKSDEIKKDSLVKCELEGPNLAVSGAELVLSVNNHSPWLVMDLSLGQVSARVPPGDSSSSCEEPVAPVYIEPGVVGFCHHTTGRVQLYDRRDQKLLDAIRGLSEDNSSLWSFTSLHECSDQSTSAAQPVCLAMVSNKGTLNVYDSRNWTTPCVSINLGLSSSVLPPLQLRFKPSDRDWVSVSGFDANVYVYQLSTQLEPVFVHNGHRYVEGFNPETLTTSHSWLPNIDNFIISSADNGTIQSWRFEDTRNSTS